jgi:hypothetical protein
MLRSLKYSAVLACGVPLLVVLSAAADAPKADAPALSGTWGKKDGELRIEFADKEVLKIAPHGDPELLAIVCRYTTAKGGKVSAKVTGFEGKEEATKKVQEHLPVGRKFSFKWSAKGDSARLEDVAGDEAETLKSHLEGDFEKK